MKICIASGNPHKIREVTAILQNSSSGIELDISSIAKLDIAEPDEPYSTFMENACHKAKYYADYTQTPTLSEDSGICIAALDNFPGVYTKDFALECGTLANAFLSLEKMLADKDDYSATFICAAVLYLPHQNLFLKYEGTNSGKISFPARGDNCFGFDPIFVPSGYSQTIAELGEEFKNQNGHRANAIKGIIEQLLINYKEYNASTHN